MSTTASSQFRSYSLNALVTQVLISGCSAAAVLVAAGTLGAERQGQLSIVLLIPILTVAIGKMGLGQAANYYIARLPVDVVARNSLALAVLLALGWSLLATGFVVAFRDSIFEGIPFVALALAIAGISLNMFAYWSASLLQAVYRINRRNLTNLAHSALYLALLAACVLTFSLDVTLAVTCWTIGIGATSVLGFVFVRKQLGAAWPLEPHALRDLAMFGGRAQAGDVLKDLMYRGDYLILAYFASSGSVGVYAIAVLCCEIVWKLPDALGIVLLPRLVRDVETRADLVTAQVCRMVVLLVALSGIGLWLLGELIITWLLGSDYTGIGQLLMWLFPGVFAFSIWKILSNELLARGKPSLYSATCLAGLVTMVALDWYLVPRWAAVGAAIGSSAGYIVSACLMVFFYKRITGRQLVEILFPRLSDWNGIFGRMGLHPRWQG